MRLYFIIINDLSVHKRSIYIQGQPQPEAGQRALERYYAELIAGSTTPTMLSKSQP